MAMAPNSDGIFPRPPAFPQDYGKPLDLLLVEDNPGDVRFLRESLLYSGSGISNITHAQNLASCLDHLRYHSADAVLLDLSLPDSQGLETVQQVHRAASDIPIVVLTGTKDENLAVEALKGGAQDYLVKGEFRGDLLLRSVRYAMERARLFKKVQKEQGRYELAAIGSNDGLWEWNFDANRLYLSLRWKLMLGYNDSEIGDSTEEWFKRVHPSDLPQVRYDLSRYLARQTPYFSNEHRLEHRNKAYRWVRSRGMAVFDGSGKPLRMAGSFTDITDHKALEENLAHQAHYDSLTRLPNRVLFMENLERSFARYKRNPHYLFAVLFMDMDRFKFINDSLGHVAGDRLLAEFAERLRSCIRPSDLVARLGGDEFTLLLDDLKNEPEATFIAQRILKEVQAPFRIGDNEALAGVSIGIAFSNCGPATPEELLKAADAAMYRAKNLGKGRYEVFDQVMRFDSIATLKLEQDFQQALQNGEFFTLYQPMFSLKTGRITGFEALLRWQHPRQGLLLPSRFIPWAEETGLLGRLDELILQTAASQNKVWQASGHPDLVVSVNVSAQQVRNATLLDRIPKILQETGLESRHLEIEIPGWMVLKEKAVILPLLKGLHHLGVRIALDHYGLGFATLKEMRDFPVNNIKIDRDLIASITQNAMEASLANMIITAAHSLGIGVAATGVETAEELEFLKKNDCDIAQGLFLSPPSAPDKLAKLFLTDNPIRTI